MEEIAHRRVQVSPSESMTGLAVKSARFAWPRGWSEAERRETVVELFGDSGILVPDGGDFRFSRPGVQEYLAAWHIVRRHPRGPSRWDPRARRYLAPRPTWPSPGSELDLFLAALWWPGARAAVERRLSRLLGERHRDPNVRLVLELVRRNLVPWGDLAPRAAEVLRRALADGRSAEQDWVNAARWLVELDPEGAAATFDSFVRTPLAAMPDRRRLFATVELAKLRPDRARQNLEILAAGLTGEPAARLATARLIGDHEPALGHQVMLRLANTPGMHDLRVDAAIATGSLDLMSDLVEHDRGVSDEARLRLAGELLGRDRGAGLRAAQRFAATAADDTGLRIAELLAPHDLQAALRVAQAIAEAPEGTEGTDEIRLRAVLLIADYAPAQAIPALQRLAADPSATGEVRVEAATLVVTDYSGPITALVDLAADPGLGRTHRAAAAEEAGKTDAATGAQLLIELAQAHPPSDAARFDLLRKAYGLDRVPAATALAELARSHRVAGPIRVKAVDLIARDLGAGRRTALYREIALGEDENAAMDAAGKLMAIDHAGGKRLMAELAGRKGASFTYRLTAAQKAGSDAAKPLRDLATSARPDAIRLQAAKMLYEFDRSNAKPALKRLVRQGRPGEVRIEAALCLPGRSAVEALLTIAADRGEKDRIRLEAASTAKGRDRQRGRQALEELAEDARVSRSVQEAARKQLRK